mmetsp:Transcript_12649/g.18938  ORF Transcript_12649/g.18938 Transcript_12649/m.18938 type:complete len:321 (+) Transcript_12649:105-1067(+)|eukprot:CAMPEP_0167752766 /NCGR_PEP_ID=MMETSP0110_2-20121227/7325_1 /TAXON_ID=629695 /ORGANISM="Gymnochlora sp., Strain CCMP2014" /LENGTH=320 /DNA_ID=CAMNT_0007638427 /DNA_START=27 /DNA_END=989 /DNA_ORIENTATION=-
MFGLVRVSQANARLTPLVKNLAKFKQLSVLRGGRQIVPQSTPISVGSALKLSAGIIGAWNAAGFIATAGFGTHKLTDITGTTAFIASSIGSLYVLLQNGNVGMASASRAIIIVGCVSAWAARLGSFLFQRIMNSDKDPRLEYMFRKEGEPFLFGPSAFPLKLGTFWVIQAAWAWVSLLPATVAIATRPGGFSPLSTVGLAGFLLGFTVETVADMQKSNFKGDEKNPNRKKWCDVGLWKFCRHPNYLGEMIVWWSIFAMSQPGPVWTIISPLFVMGLLNYVSGIPLIEARYEEKYGDDPEYQKYKESTPSLIPNLVKILKQ